MKARCRALTMDWCSMYSGVPGTMGFMLT
jgi:hypothetical protein